MPQGSEVILRRPTPAPSRVRSDGRGRPLRDNGTVPTNVPPEFKKVQAEFRKASDPHEKLELLREMMRVVPKHKGTDHLRADIKKRIKELSEEISAPRRGGTRTAPQVAFRQEGAAQLALVGPPNSGKSALHSRLTGSHSTAEPYPYATRWPQPGMFRYEDTAFHLIDVPSIGVDDAPPYLYDTLQHADGCLFVVDLSRPGAVEEAAVALSILDDRNVQLLPEWPHGRPAGSQDEDDLFGQPLPTLLVASKVDLVDDPGAEVEVLEDLLGVTFPTICVSATTDQGLDQLGPWLFDHLGVVRVYTKVPGQPVDHGQPYSLRRGDKVIDLAEMIHKDVARDFSFARVWGEGHFDGQQVGRDHVLTDGDVVEVHS